ncbi:ubiquitin carboxy-terminal hydrolase (macronuclear) [Tetrahymena thermophila SB210]|uniref:Ubiquitin carboxyl-terminal hydrolase n=1 Tax=Tetrahymena thermophila (strain SB210) TaxID=312017 RepID=Q24I73_TETTS|nr:ubiquitin carboxy-terminal hydrolase [Tetrahymena thermophila SB210]EAS07365.3 ubiquitin carboxy-terminal hydrolase [Tetrahymena thermophila SB210]|eukprot:XP_001027607.3 ubiquitin carboxy-terminal hydrolase [Tetrahymena thermophila SB210]
MNQNLKQQVENAKEMGFRSDIIERAQQMYSKGDNLIDLCLEIQSNQNQNQNLIQNMGPSPQLSHKRTDSYMDHIDYDQDFNLTDRIRKKNHPVGLMNVGNTCYFNSLIQSYFNNSEFCKYILKYRYPSRLDFNKLTKYLGEQKSKRVIASINLVVHLQRLFSFMVLSDKKFFNPTNLLKNIVNDFGERLKIGDQQDIGEFNLTFLSRVEEGLIYSENNVTKLEDKWLAESSSQNSQASCDTQSNQEEFEEDKRIKSLFFGKRTQVSIFYQDEQEIKHQESQQFSSIYLQTECKDLISAWEEQRNYTVDDFKNDKNEKVIASMQFWISKIPEVLLFQIQRMQYDQKTKEVVKIHTEFSFDKEIYVDRFLEVNKDMYFQIQNKQQSLKKQKDDLIQQLEYYQNYSQSQLGILQILELTQKFYQDPIQKDLQIAADAQEKIVSILDQSKIKCLEKIQSLESQLKKIKDEEDLLFQSMKNQKYILQSILIHKGSSAEFGHYFSYIYDLNQQKWFKYDDINCIEVEESEVLRNAKGFADQSAYGLIYINEDLAKKNRETIYKQDSTNLVQYLPQNLKEELIKENKQFQTDLEEYHLAQQASLIIREYDKRFTFIEQYIRKFNKMSIDKKFPCLINFGGFLYYQGLLNYFQLHLLDTSLKAQISPSYGLHDLLNDQKLLLKLKEQIRNLYQNRGFNLNYSNKEIQFIEMKFAEYIQNVKCCIISCIIMESALNQDWENSLIAIYKLIKINNPEQAYFRSFGDFNLSLILLKLSCLIFDFCGQDTPQNIFKIVTIIVAFSKNLPKNYELVLKQIKQNLNDFTKNAEQIFDKTTLKSYNEHLKAVTDQSKNDQYASIVQKPYELIERKIEEIQKDMDNMYNWSIGLSEDKYLNRLLELQKQFDQSSKKFASFFNLIFQKQSTFGLKERVNTLHSDIFKK